MESGETSETRWTMNDNKMDIYTGIGNLFINMQKYDLRKDKELRTGSERGEAKRGEITVEKE